MGARPWKGFLSCLVGMVAFGAGQVAPAAAADVHLDCSAISDGNGSAGSPFNSARAFDLDPGDRLLLKRGTTCTGELVVRGSGTAAQPVAVGAYGSGGLPRIVGTGWDAVRLEEVSNVTISDLDVSNPGSGSALGEGDSIRNGLKLLAQWGTVRNVTVSGLTVHDVDGDLTKTPDGSAAIQATAIGAGRFAGLRIKGNKIDSVSRSGISIMGTDDPDRPRADQPWPAASTDVVVEGNRIDLIAGDGIVPRGTDGALVQGNVVSRGNLAGKLDTVTPICNAGIWTFRANNTVIRGNEVFGMKHNGCDGTGFDVDYRQDGTVIEGNYSHDNEGGFVLLCTDSAIHRADVRFNLSVDDASMIDHGPCGFADGIYGDLSGIRMYNNTVVGDTPMTAIQTGPAGAMYAPGDFAFTNNLVYARKPHDAVPCGENCSHNAFFNLPIGGTDGLSDDPLLIGPLTAGKGLATADGFKLGTESPLRGAGVAITNGGESDFFGNPVPATPAIGFDQTQLTSEPPPPGPNCARARATRKKAAKRVTRLKRSLRKLKRRHASRPKVRRAARKLRQGRRQLAAKNRFVRRNCRA